jgi:hypothetical protein
MYPAHPGPDLVPVAAAFGFAAEAFLRFAELALGAAQELRAGDLAAIGQHREMGQAQVDARLGSHLRQHLIADLDDETGEVPPGSIPYHRHRRRHARQPPRPAHRHVPDLGQPQLAAGGDREPGVAGEPDGLPPVLARPEPGQPGLRPFRSPLSEAKKFL